MNTQTKERSQKVHSSEQAVSTTSLARLPIFLPIKKINKKVIGQDIRVVNQWGKCEIKNCKLTQIHRDIIDYIFTFHERKYFHRDTGDITFLFTPHRLLKALGDKYSNNHKWLKEKLNELRLQDIIVTTGNDKYVFTSQSGIILRHMYSSYKDTTKSNNKLIFGKQDTLYAVTFSYEYLKFFQHELNLHYQHLVPDILSLKNAVNKSLVRFCLSHTKPLRYRLSIILRVIYAVRENMSRQAIEKIVTRVIEEKDQLKGFGINIALENNSCEYYICYRQHPEVFVSLPCNQFNTLLQPI